MGPTVHSLVNLVAGDDWQFNAILNDVDGNPLDLTSASVQWSLLNFNSIPALAASDFVVSISTTPGYCSVVVPSSSSTKLASGSYSDFWRVTPAGGAAQTLIRGPMRILTDPFVAPHSWDFTGMRISTGVKPGDSQSVMATRNQVVAVYDLTQ
jgi:hypothetical protein